MTKSIKIFLTYLYASLFTVNTAISTHSASLLDPLRVWGPATKAETGGEDIQFLSLNNQSSQSLSGELQIIVSNVYTRILDATTGLPFSYEDIKDGEIIYAYIGPAKSLSPTPTANASLLLCNIPADYKVPDYLIVESLSWNTSRTQASLTATNGSKYIIPANCETTPYLSRNIVTLDDLTPGCFCLLWSNDQNIASRIINFSNRGIPAEDLPMGTGWQTMDGNWYYYKEDGTMALEWILDNDKYYYFDPETGIMHTGFLTLNGNTYYFQEDGSLLTTPRIFTPDEAGVLH